MSEQEKEAWTFAQRAVQCDEKGLVDTAVFYYTEAAQALLLCSSQNSAYAAQLVEKANEYISRAEQLKSTGEYGILPMKVYIEDWRHTRPTST